MTHTYAQQNGLHFIWDDPDQDRWSHRVLLPDDADLGSVTSRLSKEGLVIIEVSRDPALLSSDRNVEVFMEVDEPQPEEQAKQVVKWWYRRSQKDRTNTE